MKELLLKLSGCTICVPHLEFGPRPILSVDLESKIIVIDKRQEELFTKVEFRGMTRVVII